MEPKIVKVVKIVGDSTGPEPTGESTWGCGAEEC